MATEDIRKSMGQTVRDTAVHYYEGLARISSDLAAKQFESRLFSNDPLAISALRMAEFEFLAENVRS